MNKFQAKGEIIARVKIKEQEAVVEACVAAFDEANAAREFAYSELQAALDKYLELINFEETDDETKKEDTTDAVHTPGKETDDGSSGAGDAHERSAS